VYDRAISRAVSENVGTYMTCWISVCVCVCVCGRLSASPKQSQLHGEMKRVRKKGKQGWGRIHDAM
jgi:hypothetical protein